MNKERLHEINPEEAKSALINFIMRFNDPAFGSLPKKEIELLVFDLMHEIKIIKPKDSLYKLMTDLKITKTKASQLLFDLEVRKYNLSALDIEFKKALQNSKFYKNSDYFLIEIENPLLHAYFRDKIKSIGYISDTSFNSDIIRIPLDGVMELINVHFLEERDKELIRKALIKAGATDSSFKGVLKSAFKKLGERVIGEAAEGVTQNLDEYFSPLFSLTADKIQNTWEVIFTKDEKEK